MLQKNWKKLNTYSKPRINRDVGGFRKTISMFLTGNILHELQESIMTIIHYVHNWNMFLPPSNALKMKFKHQTV